MLRVITIWLMVLGGALVGKWLMIPGGVLVGKWRQMMQEDL